MLACEFSVSSRVMNFVGSSLKEGWQTKFHVAFQFYSYFSPFIVPFASFSAFVSCQNSQINICKKDFMWDELEKNAQL